MTRNEYGDLSTLLISKLQVLETKVDALNQDRVTRSDFENLRKEVSGSYVPRDTYEARHSSLIERDAQLDLQHKTDMKDLKDYIDKNISLREKAIEQLQHQIEQRDDRQLSQKDRFWMRFSQIASALAIVVSVIDVLLQHVKFQ